MTTTCHGYQQLAFFAHENRRRRMAHHLQNQGAMNDSAKAVDDSVDNDRRPTIMTLEEVAKYLRVHKSTVYRLTRAGAIPSTRVSHQWRYRKARVDEWLARQGEENGDGR